MDSKDCVTALTSTPGGDFIISGSLDQSIKIIDLESRQVVHHFRDILNGILSSLKFL